MAQPTPKPPHPATANTSGADDRDNSWWKTQHEWPQALTDAGMNSHGLFNSGSSCYRNAVLLCLLHQPAFCNYVTQMHHYRLCGAPTPSDCTTCALQRLVKCYWSPEQSGSNRFQPDSECSIRIFENALVHDALCDWPRELAIGEDVTQDLLEDAQSDAYSFLLHLIRMLRAQNEFDRLGPFDKAADRMTSLGLEADMRHLDQLFKVKLNTQWTCDFCGKQSHTSNDIDGVDGGLAINITIPESGLSILEYLHHHVFEETREITCDSDRCMRLIPTYRIEQDGTIVEGNFGIPMNQLFKSTITRTPELLIVQQKRFEYHRYYGPRALDAREDPVQAHESLDLSDYADRAAFPHGLVYHCEGIVAYAGDLDSGHYISVVKPQGAESFFALDDSSPPMLDSGGAFDAFSPYIMVYRRVRQ